MPNFSDMLKKAQEMQQRMSDMQAEMEHISVEGSAGAGMVKITLSGKGHIKQVSLDPSLFREEEKDVVEDLIKAAHNDAKEKLDARMQEEMAELTGGLGLPPGFKLPF